MQALYQLSYSPLLLRPPGLPGGDANITRSTGPNTKSFPFCPIWRRMRSRRA
ncbi:hypothetical protein SAM23877_2622 [Streptomyces ambofaciens ATCC 23877]|uniref:Uncharacterized protein n=1 Tax=Streptomyces ambofaciens (strain ATCC 23877 / 3486 / DSM 40053 / JCM 4204 / NBRC 12836 / NRRL B-2516) TaxID=278992 RepID=A0A0K2ARX6_STRA7|nr:hypothetical protein SAM23877_2622 [Streptomyces ambofaciens ATCC 23877]